MEEQAKEEKVALNKQKKIQLMENLKEMGIFLLIIFLIILVRIYLVTPAVINGESMQPNLNDGEIVLLFKTKRNIERFEIIVHQDNDSRLVKRVIGLPGEHIEYIDNELYVDGDIVKETFSPTKTEDFRLEELFYQTIPDNYYFVLGDNRSFSRDSRTIGLIHHDNIMGRSSVRLYPLSKIGRIE